MIDLLGEMSGISGGVAYWAHVGGLRPNDLVTRIGDRGVADTSGFQAAMEGVFEEKPKVVRIFVRRGHRTHFVFIEPNWNRLKASK